MGRSREVTDITVTPIVYRPRRGLSRNEAAVYVGVSTTKFDELVKDGTMPLPLRIGSRVIWDMRRIDEAFDDLSTEGDEVDTWADFRGESTSEVR